MPEWAPKPPFEHPKEWDGYTPEMDTPEAIEERREKHRKWLESLPPRPEWHEGDEPPPEVKPVRRSTYPRHYQR